MKAAGDTPMGEALWWVIQEMAPLKESRKIVIIVTDGMPNAIKNAQTAIAEAGRLGLELYGLGLGNDAVKALLPGRSVVLGKLTDLPRALFKLLGEALKFNR
jgi:nitric oxide reductase activation protein